MTRLRPFFVKTSKGFGGLRPADGNAILAAVIGFGSGVIVAVAAVAAWAGVA